LADKKKYVQMIFSKNKHLILVVGPTAVGKTAMGIELSQHFHTEIISADSRQMFRELRIGTAVPTDQELNTTKHHFIQDKSVTEYYNASMFEVEVLALLETLFHRHDIVLMIGGSTLYIDAVCHGIDDLPTVDMNLREQLMQKYREEGIGFLRAQLKMLDPEHYRKVDLQNPNRMLKAIEISLMMGKPYSSLLTATRKERDFNIIKLGINRERGELFNRINQRVDQMIGEGLVEEVKRMEPYRNFNALKTVGYREIFDYLDEKITLNQAIEQIKTNTRRYAKRQITWFSRYPEMPWFHPAQYSEILDYIYSKIR
jgi:tRNA dimethylallyltransferase